MFKIIQVISLVFSTTLQVFINPIYWIVIGIIYLQYKKIGKMEVGILGINKESIAKRVSFSALIGLVAGILGSLVIVALGVSIEINDFKYIFLTAILLMFIHPRFLCFSYGGGIISIISLIFGYPKINVSSVMAIVAVLHLVESFLILIDGDKSKIPIFIEKGNKVVGGFNMVRFWPIPFIVLIATAQSLGNGGVNMPDWWPLFRPEGFFNTENLNYIMIAVMAALGYGDMAISDYPEKKVRESARNLSIFSIILLVLSLISSYVYVFKYIAALFSPIAHELLIQLGRRKEKYGKPAFASGDIGVKILDVMPNGVGEKIGLRPGDIIFRINGYLVNSKEEINQILSYIPTYVWIDYYDTKNKIRTKEYNDYRNGIRNLGILLIPRETDHVFMVKEMDSFGARLLRWIKEKLKY